MKVGLLIIVIGMIIYSFWALSWEFKKARENKDYFEKIIKLLEAKEDIDIGAKLNLNEEGMKKYRDYVTYLQKEHPREEYRQIIKDRTNI